MYANLALLLSELRVETNEPTPDEAELLRALAFVESEIDRQTEREYAPRKETRYFDCIPLSRNGPIDGYDLWLDQALLDATTVTNGDGTVVSGSTYTLLPKRDTCKSRIHLTSGNFWTYTNDPVEAISILGTWAFHSRPSEAWLSSGDTVEDNPLTNTATSLTVNDADGQDALSRAPRFSPGQLLRIESEYLLVLKVDIENDRLTVQRGVRGSTAASHAQNTAIDIWQAEPQIERAAQRWAVMLYKRHGEWVTQTTDGLTTISYPKEAPEDIAPILAQYLRLHDLRKA